VLEALANVVRHSAGRMCRLSVSVDEARNRLCLQIADDGRGLPGQHRAGVGLVSMRERAEELGGRCSVTSRPSGGTLVMVELPCPPRQLRESTDGNA
jgi:signal transduction histidine kinase